MRRMAMVKPKQTIIDQANFAALVWDKNEKMLVVLKSKPTLAVEM